MRDESAHHLGRGNGCGQSLGRTPAGEAPRLPDALRMLDVNTCPGVAVDAVSRDTQVTIDGRVYLIPDIWLAGFCRSNGCTVQQAAGWWAYQTYLAEQEVKP